MTSFYLFKESGEKKESKYPRIEEERTPEKHEGRRERAKGKLER